MKFKRSKVKGKEYLQLWDGDDYKGSLGTADQAYKLLVRVKELEEMTNFYCEILTKFTKGKYGKLTNESFSLLRHTFSEEKATGNYDYPRFKP